MIAIMLPLATAYFLGWNWYDWLVLVALGYGIWSGMRNGFVGELTSVIGVVAMLALAIKGFEPVGKFIRAYVDFTEEMSNLIAFVVISLVVYVIAVSVRQVLHDKMKRGGVLPVTIENVGGAGGGFLRMLGIMSAITIGICLTRSEFWHRQVGRDSQFGAAVARKIPRVDAMVNRSFKEKIWFMDDIKRREDPDLPSTVPDKN